MRHHNRLKKFGRETDARRALLRSLVLGLIVRGKIKTTEAKAKALRPFVERLITLAKTDTVAKRRLVAARLGNQSAATQMLFKQLAPRYRERNGGYVRIVKLPVGNPNGRTMATVEFV